MSSQPSEALGVDQEAARLEDPSRFHQGACPLLELKRLRRRARHIVEKWLQHYHIITGVCGLDRRSLQPLCQQRLSQKKPSVPLPSLTTFVLKHNSSAQSHSGSRRGQITRRLCAPTSNLASSLLKKQCPVLVPWLPANWHPSPMPHDPFGSAIACPVVLRAALRGEESWQSCRCSCKQIPILTDTEYDAFIAGQGSDSEQILVVSITSPVQNFPSSPSLSSDRLEELYRKMNRKRNMPCTQCQMDSYRLLRYEVPSPEARRETHVTLLQRRHNVAPGMFLLYLRGKLLFANYIFSAYGCSVRDLQKQIAKTRRDYRLGQFLPPDFKSSSQMRSDTVLGDGSNPGLRGQTLAEGGLCVNQSLKDSSEYT
ncbi:uncharacterized protein LOC134094385 [Sardina pilchardus]|uniref:uncharacterized protein LOC134094385 n=1 Tax=Sardina pilchardus TaxID=27697 RepID=UPI002E105E02